MPLIVLEDAINPLMGDVKEKYFGEVIRDARDALGMKLYRAAEFVGITPARLKNLETNYFRVMPSEGELIALSKLYDLSYNTLYSKAKERVEYHGRAKKVRTMRDRKGEVYDVLCDQRCKDGILLDQTQKPPQQNAYGAMQGMSQGRCASCC